ncbi:cytochrome P450 [Streptomyces sp. NPDC049555]|uniref:cytochrome P450 n=1 Tax=Streptomyces sp. NPDC049555 TaxID=3154930 RepID=UPI00343F34DC
MLHTDLLGPLPELLHKGDTTAPTRVRTPTGDDLWLVSDYALARTVLTDPRFSRAAAAAPHAPRLNTASPSPSSIMSMDGHDHARLRRVTAAAFTTGKVARLAPMVQEVSDGLLADMAHQGPPADLVTAFAAPLPVAVLGALLGVPPADRPVFDASVEVLFDITASSDEQKARHRLLLVDYMAALIDRKRRSTDDDLLTELIRAHDDGVLSRAELVSLGLALLTAGYETTVGQIALAALAVLQGVLPASALTDPARAEGTVEELLRTTPSTPLSFPRVATEDVDLAGVVVRAGEGVVVSLLHGNRDAAVFADPDAIRPGRTTPHLAFGHGIHRCLGAPLARLQIRTALAGLFTRFPALTPAATPGEAVVWKDGLVTRGLARLVVTW